MALNGGRERSGLQPITLGLLRLRSQANVLAAFAYPGFAAKQNLDELALGYIPG